jgi:hypothetical protein
VLVRRWASGILTCCIYGLWRFKLLQTLAVDLKIKHTHKVWSIPSTHRYSLQRHKSIYPHKDLNATVLSNFIHNSPKVETTKHQLADEWINKLCYTHIIETFSPLLFFMRALIHYLSFCFIFLCVTFTGQYMNL